MTEIFMNVFKENSPQLKQKSSSNLHNLNNSNVNKTNKIIK